MDWKVEIRSASNNLFFSVSMIVEQKKILRKKLKK